MWCNILWHRKDVCLDESSSPVIMFVTANLAYLFDPANSSPLQNLELSAYLESFCVFYMCVYMYLCVYMYVCV